MTKTYIEITLQVDPSNREGAGAVYSKYKQPFLTTIAGAKSKELLVRDEDVQVLHGFDSRDAAENYLKSALFNEDVVTALTPYLSGDPEVRIYDSPTSNASPANHTAGFFPECL